jgi:RNA polymerase sigma factor (sigma-70 family)
MANNLDRYNEDLRIVSRLKEGDLHSFEEIYNRFYKPLLNYGYQFNGVKAYVHDAIQELFIELWNKRLTLIINFSLEAYLFKSLRYKIQHQVKKDHATNKHVADYYTNSFEAVFDEQGSLNSGEFEAHILNKLKESVLQLAPKQKELIYLIFYNKLSYDEASKIMGISTKTAYNQVNSAIKNLRTTMAKNGVITVLLFLFLYNPTGCK